jgi:hypothetical protein
MTIDFEMLGLSREDVQNRVVERIAAVLMEEKSEEWDDESGTYEGTVESRAMKSLKKLIKDRIDGKVLQMANEVVLPKVAEMVETTTFRETNKWGEGKGTPELTFKEYLVQRAEAYMQEQVDCDGKAKSQTSGYSWTSYGTRVTYMIHTHLHHSIEQAMKEAVQNVNRMITGGLEATVKQKLEEITKSLKVAVQSK